MIISLIQIFMTDRAKLSQIKYAVGTSKEPIGISEYELSHFLPSPKEIEQKLYEQDDINQEGQKT